MFKLESKSLGDPFHNGRDEIEYLITQHYITQVDCLLGHNFNCFL